MPCPPSYEEQQYSGVDLLVSLARRYSGDLVAARDLLAELVDATPSAPTSLRTEIAACLAAEVPVAPPSWSEVEAIHARGPVQASSDADLEALVSFREPARDWLQRAELALCIASSLLVQLSDYIGPLSELQAWRLGDLTKKHREHREGDRRARIAHYDNAGRPDLMERARAIPTDLLLRDRRCMDDLDD